MADGGRSLEAVFLEAAWAAAEAATLDDLGRQALDLVAEAVGASNVLLYRYDEAGVVHGVAGSLVPALPSYVQELFEEDPVQHHLLGLAPERDVVLTLQGMDVKRYRGSAAYTDFYRPHDMEWLLGCWLTPLPYGAPGMTGILFTRSKGEPDFDAQDGERLQRVLPGLRAVARRDLLVREQRRDRSRQAAESLLAAVATRPLAAFDVDGALLWITPRAEGLLGPRWRPSDDGGDSGALARAARALAAGAQRRDVTPPPTALRMVREDGTVLRAELSISRLPSGEPFVLVSIEEPAAPPDGVARLAREADLTRAEASVLAGLAEGRSNPEIAARLHVSVETVRTHVARILGKLGVKSRTEAALRVARSRT